MRRSRRPSVGRPVAHPKGLERRYAATLRQRVRSGYAAILAGMERLGPQFEAESRLLTIDDVRTDRMADVLEQLLFLFRPLSAEREAEAVAGRTEQFNRDRVRESLGIDPVRSEPWLAPLLADWSSENARLIQSLDDGVRNRVSVIVRKGFREGRLWRDVARRIRSDAGIDERRAAVIARDQIGSLSGQLTRARQKQAGITKYVWNTSRDERVRPDHERRQGKTFSWDEPPSDGHPGQPVQCRCTASPILE